MANLLILDASSSLCSVTLLKGDERFELTEEQPRRHAQRLLPMVDEVLRLGDTAKGELDGIAYARGPGSFTGIRIAVSVVQGIAMGLELPVYGFSTLHLLANQAGAAAPGADRVISVMDAHMGELFWGAFQRSDNQSGLWQPLGDERVGSPESCSSALLEQFSSHPDSQWSVAGNGLKLLDGIEALADKSQLPQLEPLSHFAEALVKQAWQDELFADLEAYPPVYLRDSVAWKKLDEQPSLLKR